MVKSKCVVSTMFVFTHRDSRVLVRVIGRVAALRAICDVARILQR